MLKKDQKINFIPGIESITNKKLLHFTIKKSQ